MYRLLYSLVFVLSFATLAHAGVTDPGGGSSALTVKENDNVPSVSNVNTISFTNGTVTDSGGGVVEVTITGVGAPTDATYITQTTNGTLSAEQALSTLATGCMGSTTTTGVVATRTLTGTANQISITNGDCSGNPTFSIPTNPTLPGTTTGTFSGNITGNVTGNASTATALAANGANCSAGSAPLGVDASGAVEGCTAYASSVDATGGVQTASGSPITTTGTVRGAFVANAQTGTTYTVLTGDRGKFLTFSNVSPVVVTLPQAGAGFENGWFVLVKNINEGSVTITPTTSTINGEASLVLTENQGTFIVSDGTNYVTLPVSIVSEADTLQTVFNRGNTITGTSESNPVKFYGAGALNDDGWHFGTHSNGTPFINCVINGVENNCDYVRKLDPGNKFEIQNNSGTAKFTLENDTGVVTNISIDGEGTGNTITLRDEKHFAVATCQNATANPNFDTPATNAPAATCDTGSNTQKAYLAFDATTDESFQDHWILPTGFTGAIDAHFRWKAAATTGAVGWCMQLIRVPDGSTSDPAFPAQAAANCVSDTTKGTTLQENTATITGVTCTSCVAGDHVYVRISRDANGGAVTDDMTGDALLLTYGRTIRIAH